MRRRLTLIFIRWYGARRRIGTMMKDHQDRNLEIPPAIRKKPRIETQIHRRRTVGVRSPLETEWDLSQGGPPGRLRTRPSSNPSDSIRREKGTAAKIRP
ncbi:MAG TPA: hypothetical protein VD738_12370 [Nitrospira sp.]|nr:hypothetical protein [Nitrospira sp.]